MDKQIIRVSERLHACAVQGRDNLKFCCRVSMLEIYNEVISDLLAPPGGAAGAGVNLQVREDMKRGCYVEELSEEIVQNGEGHSYLVERWAAGNFGSAKCAKQSQLSCGWLMHRACSAMEVLTTCHNDHTTVGTENSTAWQ